jgi:hypothetical protein
MHGKDEVGIGRHGQAEVGREVGHLAQVAGVEEDQVAPIVDPEVAVAAHRR